MLLYGGTFTLNNLVVYIAYNADKVLLGRFCGAELLGIYGRASQLVNLPTDNLNSTVGQVAFSALSRVQDDPARLRSYFLKVYRLFLSLVLPTTMGCALFAQDIIRVFLGSKWHEAASIFRLLAPGILGFALVNPFAWLLQATGRAGRSLRIALVVTPVLILAYVVGLGRGPEGVAFGYSVCIVLLSAPVILWAKHGTLISAKDVLQALTPPVFSVVLGAAASLAARPLMGSVGPALLRLFAESGLLFAVYGLVLLFVMNQKDVYFALLRDTGLWPIAPRTAAAIQVVD
jgi:PST family polysaccharide transporter